MLSRHLRAGLAALLALGLTAGSVWAAPNLFVGAWEAIDIDGSNMTFTASGGSSSVRVHLFDAHASFCINQGAPQGETALRGSGTVSGDTLTFSFVELRCAGGLVFPGDGSVQTFTYVAATDTIEWQQDPAFPLTVWHRIPAG